MFLFSNRSMMSWSDPLKAFERFSVDTLRIEPLTLLVLLFFFSTVFLCLCCCLPLMCCCKCYIRKRRGNGNDNRRGLFALMFANFDEFESLTPLIISPSSTTSSLKQPPPPPAVPLEQPVRAAFKPTRQQLRMAAGASMSDSPPPPRRSAGGKTCIVPLTGNSNRHAPSRSGLAVAGTPDSRVTSFDCGTTKSCATIPEDDEFEEIDSEDDDRTNEIDLLSIDRTYISTRIPCPAVRAPPITGIHQYSTHVSVPEVVPFKEKPPLYDPPAPPWEPSAPVPQRRANLKLNPIVERMSGDGRYMPGRDSPGLSSPEASSCGLESSADTTESLSNSYLGPSEVEIRREGGAEYTLENCTERAVDAGADSASIETDAQGSSDKRYHLHRIEEESEHFEDIYGSRVVAGSIGSVQSSQGGYRTTDGKIPRSISQQGWMGKNFRVRVNRKGALAISKGQASSNNAPVTRFRDQAKAQRAALMEPMIAIDDREEQLVAADPVGRLELDAMNVDGANSEVSGGMSVVSRFTNCTNPTFAPVNQMVQPGSAVQNDVISVLASAVDVIKEKQGSQSDVEYYGVLLSTLDAVPIEDVKKVYASSYLLQLIAPKVPKELLIKYYNTAKPVLDSKLRVLSSTKEAYGAVKFLLAATGILYKAQPLAFWKSEENRNSLAEMVLFTIHPHPGVRMISRRIIRTLITEEPYVTGEEIHPAARTVAKVIKEQLEIGRGNRETITRLLCLLEGVLYRMNDTTLASLLDILLQLGACADPTVRCSAFQCIQRTLAKPPLAVSLPISRNAELILALRSHQTPADISVFAYWLQALSEAHCCLSRLTPEKSINMLPETLELFGKAFNSPSAELGHAVHLSLNRLMSESIKDNAVAAQKCLEVLENALNVQNTAVWKFILQSMVVLFEESKTAVEGPIFAKVLETLTMLREKEDCFCILNIEAVIGAAIRNIGLQKVISIIELGIDPSLPQMPTDFARSWMLPLLSKNVRNESIQFFVNSVMPVLVALHDRIPKLPAFAGRLYTNIEQQVWDILPNLLASPSDFPTQFPVLAPMIGSALAHRLDIRLVLLKALRSALRFADKNGYNDVTKRFAKNYLPILFNIYTAAPTDTLEIVSKQGLLNYDDQAARLSTLETIRAYISDTPEDVRNNYFTMALDKLRDDDQPLEKKQAVADLVIALIRGLTADQFNEIFTVVEKWFTSNLSSFQKKAYKILGEMYKRINEPELRPFFEKNAPFVKKLISKGMKGILSPAWAPRIAVYRAILTTFNDHDDFKHFVESVIYQVVLTQDKSFGRPARHQAAHCFLQICSGLIGTAADADITPSVALEPVVEVVAKIYSQPLDDATEVSMEQARSALISLNMLTQKFVKYFNPSVLSKLINLVCLTLEDTRSPVKILAVRCMRILCNKLEEFVMTQFKSLLLESIFKQNLENDSSRVRKANRLLLEVLVDRYGPEPLEKATDKDDFLKQIKNIAKIKRRRERKAAGVEEESIDMEEDAMSTFTNSNTVKADTIFDIFEDSDDEDEEHKPKTTADNASIFLNEDEDEIVDLLDRDTIIQKIGTARKNNGEKKVSIEIPKKDDTFRVAKDGKIIIVNIDKKRKRYNSEMFEEDDEIGKKNQIDDDDNQIAEQMEDDATVVASTYKPGGRGIHRPIAYSQAMSVVSNATHTNGKKTKQSDSKKKTDKLEPYAYVPLRNKDRKEGLKSILKKKNTKKGKKK